MASPWLAVGSNPPHNKELDAIASQYYALGMHVVRTPFKWPRNEFYCSEEMFLRRTRSKPFNVFGNYGLFHVLETAIVFSDSVHAFIKPKQLTEYCDDYFPGKEVIMFKTTPRMLIFAVYPGNMITYYPLDDLDYVLGFSMKEKTLFTYKRLVEMNGKALSDLANHGYKDAVLFPDKEFRFFPVNMEPAVNDSKETFVMDRRAKKSIEAMRSNGFSVEPTEVSLSSLTSTLCTLENILAGGGIRCVTNIVYPEALTPEDLKLFREYHPD